MDTETGIIETHPWPPYIPPHTKILIMGTFPPQPKRWSMNFYYPNRTNDFWPMMALIFFGDLNALYTSDTKQFDIDKIKLLLDRYGIAMNDTGYRIKRLKGNASDKFLEIIEPVNLTDLLSKMPDCKSIATTGEKAAGIIAELTSTQAPKMGQSVITDTGIRIWRMPSTSRAYPMKLEIKAEYYRKMFIQTGIL